MEAHLNVFIIFGLLCCGVAITHIQTTTHIMVEKVLWFVMLGAKILADSENGHSITDIRKPFLLSVLKIAETMSLTIAHGSQQNNNAVTAQITV